MCDALVCCCQVVALFGYTFTYSAQNRVYSLTDQKLQQPVWHSLSFCLSLIVTVNALFGYSFCLYLTFSILSSQRNWNHAHFLAAASLPINRRKRVYATGFVGWYADAPRIQVTLVYFTFMETKREWKTAPHKLREVSRKLRYYAFKWANGFESSNCLSTCFARWKCAWNQFVLFGTIALFIKSYYLKVYIQKTQITSLESMVIVFKTTWLTKICQIVQIFIHLFLI